MFRSIIILICFVCFTGCTPVIERTKLENDASLEEGPEQPGIDIVARCDFRATSGEKEGMFSNCFDGKLWGLHYYTNRDLHIL